MILKQIIHVYNLYGHQKQIVINVEVILFYFLFKYLNKINLGRAGRVAHGKCYRLVKLHLYNSLASYQKPALVQESLDRVILQAKKLNIGEPKAILALALEPPNINDIEITILKLKEVCYKKNISFLFE